MIVESENYPSKSLNIDSRVFSLVKTKSDLLIVVCGPVQLLKEFLIK